MIKPLGTTSASNKQNKHPKNSYNELITSIYQGGGYFLKNGK
jgi:hypothetical protein